MKIFLLLLPLFSYQVNASFPEFFGTGPTTSGIGNQANTQVNDPSNLYYLPAMSAWAKKVSIGATMSAASHDFEPITNIVTENSTTGESGSTTVTGDANTNYEDSFNTSAHILFPIVNNAGTIGISYFAPVGKLTETNSGDPKLPEYSLYRARYRRTQLHLNYALPLNENWALSVGAHLGFQVSARVNTDVSLSNNFGSKGNAKTKIDPSLGAILSLAYRNDNQVTYFTFQQEMKSNLEAVATGEIADPSISLINVGLESMIYYDPHILRVGTTFQIASLQLLTSLEYQMWENYEAPLIQINNLGGTVRASDNYEQLKLKNIFVPKLGAIYNLTDTFALRAGLSYRQTPFDSDFSGAGNTVDTDVFMLSSGMTLDFKFWGKEIQLGGSLQYHKLMEESVTKTSGQENGAAGSKIGAPGYTLGGSIIMAMGGVRIHF